MSEEKKIEEENKSVILNKVDDFDEEDEEAKPRNLGAFFWSVLARSSIYALAQLGSSQNLRRRIMWAVVLCIGLFGLSYELYKFLSLYFQYPVIITIEVKKESDIEFPTVTVCNLNRMPVTNLDCILRNLTVDECGKLTDKLTPISDSSEVFDLPGEDDDYYSNLNEADESLSVYDEELNPIWYSAESGDITGLDEDIAEEFQPASGKMDGLPSANVSIRRRTGKSERQGLTNAFSFPNITEPTEADIRKEFVKFISLFTTMDRERRKRFGQTADDFIIGCSFKGEPCYPSNFTLFQSLQYGNCYSFNSKENHKQSLKTQHTGPNHSGLDLLLNLDSFNYLPFTESSGARVVINDHANDPDPENQGININPAQETTIALAKEIVQRLPYPYRDGCMDYGDGKNGSFGNLEGCYRACVQSRSSMKCSCVDPTFPVDGDHKYCNLYDEKQIACLDEVLNHATDENCGCVLPCKAVDYNMVISSADWPSSQHTHEYQNAIWNPTGMADMTREFFSRMDTAKVKIFYRTLEVKSFKQEPMFQDSELFSQLGGQMGIWMGISIVAVFECIEGFIAILYFCFNSAVRSKK